MKPKKLFRPLRGRNSFLGFNFFHAHLLNASLNYGSGLNPYLIGDLQRSVSRYQIPLILRNPTGIMTENSTPPAPSTGQTEKPESTLAKQIRNLSIVLVAIALSIAVFFGLRTETGESSLAALAATSTPLGVAQTNSKPTLVEFYANWCTSCQAMAKDMGELRQEFGDRINFVMLNVDNTKWLPEMLKYRVDGIPHFVYSDPSGADLASTVGEQPRTVMAANLEALAKGEMLPYIRATGQTSKVETSPTTNQPTQDDPRSHGAQVVR